MSMHEKNELISAYLDGELAAEEESAVREHLASCPDCREEHASLRAAKSWLARAPRRAMPPELMAKIEASLSRPLWRQICDRLLPPMPVWAPAGALATAALTAVVWFGAHRTAPAGDIPLEPLLAAHCRYTAEALVPASELVASNYSAQLNAYYGDSSDQE